MYTCTHKDGSEEEQMEIEMTFLEKGAEILLRDVPTYIGKFLWPGPLQHNIPFAFSHYIVSLLGDFAGLFLLSYQMLTL